MLDLSKEDIQVIQDIFNKSYTGLEKQGWVRSGDKDEHDEFKCMYRDLNGNKCAIGQVIPDSLYDERIENYSMHANIIRSIVSQSVGVYVDPFVSVLSNLQSCHDLGHTPEDMKARFISFAKAHGLTIPGGEND